MHRITLLLNCLNFLLLSPHSQCFIDEKLLSFMNNSLQRVKQFPFPSDSNPVCGSDSEFMPLVVLHKKLTDKILIECVYMHVSIAMRRIEKKTDKKIIRFFTRCCLAVWQIKASMPFKSTHKSTVEMNSINCKNRNLMLLTFVANNFYSSRLPFTGTFDWEPAKYEDYYQEW